MYFAKIPPSKQSQIPSHRWPRRRVRRCGCWRKDPCPSMTLGFPGPARRYASQIHRVPRVACRDMLPTCLSNPDLSSDKAYEDANINPQACGNLDCVRHTYADNSAAGLNPNVESSRGPLCVWTSTAPSSATSQTSIAPMFR